MNCKRCGAMVERAVEGETICSRCWAMSQMTDEDLAAEMDRRTLEREMRELARVRARCEGCGTSVQGEEAANRMCWPCLLASTDLMTIED